MTTTAAALDDELTSDERATLYVIAVYACAGGGARFAVAQPSVVARVRRLRDRGLVDCEPLGLGGGAGVLARLTSLGSDVVARSLRSADALWN